ncbi:MAG: sigma 54-interacting transcriptional regulator [Planctomycetaceae bacterium]
MNERGKWILGGLGVAIIVYSVVMLGNVATSPDIRLRVLLIDTDEIAIGAGVEIHGTPGLDPQRDCKGEAPRAGDLGAGVPPDLLRRIGDRPIDTFPDFTNAIAALRSEPTPSGGKLDDHQDPLKLSRAPSLVEYGDHGSRWVRVEFDRAGETERRTCYLRIQSLPPVELATSFVWFVLQLAIFSLAMLAFWHRPFDRPARLFFAMCVVSTGAFIGGFHWWMAAGNFALNAPFVVCALLLPAVTLHFFLVYPRPKSPAARRPRATVAALYSIPALSALAVLTLHGYFRWLSVAEPGDRHAAQVLEVLHWLRLGITAYLALAAVYFLATLWALVDSFFTTRNPLERNQVKWILWAALAATVPVGYSLYLAQFDRVGFALGKARLPMFLASLSFMLAYAVGIARYKLMLMDQIVSKGMLYYVASGGLSLAFGLTIASASLGAFLLNVSMSYPQVFLVAGVLLVSIVMLLWLRDGFQEATDRRFFREKYRLDQALERVNRAVGRLADPEALAQRMLSSCRDVLRIEQAALYLRAGENGAFQLIAAQGNRNLPVRTKLSDECLATLREGGSAQRVNPDTRSAMSPVQALLRELRADLIHVLEAEGEIAGLVVLGNKSDGASFTAEDLTFLHALGQITNVALHGARVHQQVARLDEDLRLKIDTIAAQQRQIAMLQSEITSTQQSAAADEAVPAPSFRREALKGTGPAIRGVLETVRKVAGSDSTVLVRGESGTGKELLAQVIHDNSPRRDGPMIRVHCASLSPGLLESELFGHVKGAFTGAHRDKIGRFEMADGGTLFLDEIGEISLETQVKLLRVLQERCFEPVGGTRTVHVDVRLVTATHRNLEELITQGRFREDLYYRLNVISVTLPPLRERHEDILELALFFLNRASSKSEKRISHIDSDALAAMERYAWPGNVRELQNVIERAVVLAEEGRITLPDLPADFSRIAAAPAWRAMDAKPHAARPSATSPSSASSSFPIAPSSTGGTGPSADDATPRGDGRRATEPANDHRNGDVPSSRDRADDEERRQLLHALEQSGGNKAQAARLLGLPRSTYFSKLKKHGLDAGEMPRQ